MKLPICGFDAKNSVLCPQCESKIESGELTKADIDASMNLAKIAKAYGIKTHQINNHNEMKANLKNILKLKVPIVCDVKINEDQKVIPKLEFGRAIDDMNPRLSNSEMSSNIISD